MGSGYQTQVINVWWQVLWLTKSSCWLIVLLFNLTYLQINYLSALVHGQLRFGCVLRELCVRQCGSLSACMLLVSKIVWSLTMRKEGLGSTVHCRSGVEAHLPFLTSGYLSCSTWYVNGSWRARKRPCWSSPRSWTLASRRGTSTNSWLISCENDTSPWRRSIENWL